MCACVAEKLVEGVGGRESGGSVRIQDFDCDPLTPTTDPLIRIRRRKVNVEDKVKAIFKKVLDVEPDEIKPDQSLVQCLGVDSTELVEISVGIKKELGVPLGDGELKKTHSFNQIVEILKSKGAN